jgi:hypothetical protein
MNWRNPLIIRPAPASRARARPTSTITSPAWKRRRPGAPVVPCAPCLSPDWRSTRAASTAGASPKTTPQKSPRATVTPATIGSIRASTKLRSSIAPERARRPVAHQARSSPRAQPRSESSTLSARSCRTRRPRPAPRAERTDISFCRPAARARSRFATLVQAISSTNAAAPSATRSCGRRSPNQASASGVMRREKCSLLSAYSWAIRPKIVSSSCCARSTETPGASRATANIQR